MCEQKTRWEPWNLRTDALCQKAQEAHTDLGACAMTRKEKVEPYP